MVTMTTTTRATTTSDVTAAFLAAVVKFRDVYWSREGRESIDAVVLFGAALSVGLWGRPFFRALGREIRLL